MQTTVIADQNGGKLGERQIVEMKTGLVFLASTIKEGRPLVTPDAVSIKQPKTIFEYGLPDI